MYNPLKIPVKVTAYDGFGKVFKEIELENYPAHYKWPAVLLPGGEILSMPSIVVEPLEESLETLPLVDDAPHTIDLISYSGVVIRSWVSRGTVACVSERAVFIPHSRVNEVWAFGHYYIKKV